MSRRNSLAAKKERRLRKSLRVAPYEEQMDLVHYVKQRARVSTRLAERVIMAGTLRVDSHKIGVEQTPRGPRLKRYVSATLRDRIQIVVPQELKASVRD